MRLQPFSIHPLNQHYEGAYAASQIEWRRVASRDKVHNLQVLLRGRPVRRVLEVGCGTGSVLMEVVARGIGSEHVGVDIADPREHLHPGAERLDLRTYDGERLPFADRSFDLVIATHVVEHVPNPRQFLEELKRVCGGFIYVEVPCEFKLHLSRAKMQASLDIGHINGYSPEFFLILLQTSGLDVVEFELFDHSRDVHQFNTSRLKGALRMAIRRVALRSNALLASRLFNYHCGALVVPSPGTGAR